MNDTLYVLLSTFSDSASARDLASKLVEEGLVACAQIETRPITSIYRWQGKVEEEDEVLLRLKTTDGARERAVRRLRELHPYDTPQIVWMRAEADPDYAAWARAQCGDSEA